MGSKYKYQYNDIQKIKIDYFDFEGCAQSAEFQEELGLNWYDYGARNYDPAIGRWMSVDPLAEDFMSITTYAYVANDPVSLIDPNGLDIYRYDDETGDIILLEETDDDFDQIVNAKYNRETGEYSVRRNRRGEVRSGSVKVDNIEKGILEDGSNFREQSNVIEVGGEGQPTIEGVEDFVFQLSNFVDKEISGSNWTNTGEENISYVAINRYRDNTDKSALDYLSLWSTRRDLRNSTTLREKWHTHLSKFSDRDRLRSSPADDDAKSKFIKTQRERRDNGKEYHPLDTRFKIITNPDNEDY